MAGYRVLVVIKDKFYPFDAETFPTFAAARRHQAALREGDQRRHDTAILRPDGAILNYIDEEMEKCRNTPEG